MISKTTETKILSFLSVPVFSLILLSAGCSGNASVKPESAVPENVRTVRAGDLADIGYLCKLKTGEVVASTDSLTADQPRSTLFVPADKQGPVPVRAGAPFPVLAAGQEMLLEDEIAYRLADVVVGMKEGEDKQVELIAKDIPARSEENYVASLARVRKRPKEMTIPRDVYEQKIGKSAEVGQPFVYDPAIQGSVAAVTDKDVVIRFSAPPGSVAQTPFGPGRILETEKEFEIVIDAKVGSLIRSGILVGRITSVDDKVIKVDYRNPFGREPLTCEVKVEKITETKQTADQKTAHR